MELLQHRRAKTNYCSDSEYITYTRNVRDAEGCAEWVLAVIAPRSRLVTLVNRQWLLEGMAVADKEDLAPPPPPPPP